MYQEIQIIGTIGREPDLRYTADGKAICSFSVAANRTVAGGAKETTWFKVTLFERLAESCHKFAHKGMRVHVVGHLVSDKTSGGPRLYQKQDGTWASAFEVNARGYSIVDWNGQEPQRAQAQPQQQQYRNQAQPAQPKPQMEAQQQSFADDIPW